MELVSSNALTTEEESCKSLKGIVVVIGHWVSPLLLVRDAHVDAEQSQQDESQFHS